MTLAHAGILFQNYTRDRAGYLGTRKQAVVVAPVPREVRQGEGAGVEIRFPKNARDF